MNPSLLDYLRTQQEQDPDMGQEMIMPEPRMQAQPMPLPQMQEPLVQAPQMQAPVQAPQEQAPYNPFDAGIQKAISSARESLGMTEQQKDRALRNSILAFGDNIGQQPRQKGFWNNFGSAARALSPAIREYDKSEDESLTQNNTLANQVLAHQAAEQQRANQADDRAWKREREELQRTTQADDRAWKRGYAEDQLSEQIRAHDMTFTANQEKAKTSGKKSVKEQEKESSNTELNKTLQEANKLLTDDLGKEETYRGRTSDLLSKFTPGGFIPNKKQARINALGDILRGKLFNAWGYRNQAEFEHVPSISADNPPEVNLEVIKTLQNMLGGSAPQTVENSDTVIPQEVLGTGGVLMNDRNGVEHKIPSIEVEEALQDGFTHVGNS